MAAPAGDLAGDSGPDRHGGFVAELLSKQDTDGQWAGGAYLPAGFFGSAGADLPGQPWTPTTWALKDLREWAWTPPC